MSNTYQPRRWTAEEIIAVTGALRDVITEMAADRDQAERAHNHTRATAVDAKLQPLITALTSLKAVVVNHGL